MALLLKALDLAQQNFQKGQYAFLADRLAGVGQFLTV
jgi:hypothetical protein